MTTSNTHSVTWTFTEGTEGQEKYVEPTVVSTLDPKEGEDAEKAGKRMSTQQVGKLHAALETIKNLFSWANYDEDKDEEDAKRELPEGFMSKEKSSGFKIYNTPDGLRWLSFSSNAFQDLEKELFTTKALQEAVDWADNHAIRGPLRLFHVPDADIGDADFQSVIGRFLVESGTFRDNELGRKAVEYFDAHPEEEFQVSIGFTYRQGDEEDGVYDWLRIRERSLCPVGHAANPFTSFAIGEIGGKEMDERKLTMLTNFFGKDLASAIVGKAEGQTKDLEETVAFKSIDVLEDFKGFVESLPEGEIRDKGVDLVTKYAPKEDKKPETADKKEDDEEDKEDKKEAEKPEPVDLEPITNAIHTLAEVMKDLKTSVADISAEVKELKEKDAKSPKGREAFRASESDKNILDPDKLKELTGEEPKQPVNPIRGYIEDFVALSGSGINRS